MYKDQIKSTAFEWFIESCLVVYMIHGLWIELGVKLFIRDFKLSFVFGSLSVLIFTVIMSILSYEFMRRCYNIKECFNNNN